MKIQMSLKGKLGNRAYAPKYKTIQARSSRVIFKRNSWLVVLTENVKIQYFFKKIFNSCIYVLVDNRTMKIQKKIEYVKSHILENIVK